MCPQRGIKVLTMEQFQEFERMYKRLFLIERKPSPERKVAKKSPAHHTTKPKTDDKTKSLKAARKVLRGYLKTRKPRNPEAY
jgi:hypothetical protein